MESFFENQNLSLDNLTHAYSREVITSYAEHLISEGESFSMALVDIDNFKYINDTYGHTAGDKIICEVTDRIRNSIGNSGVVGRYGGDEFVVVFKNIVNYDEVWNACHKILVNMSETEMPDFNGLYITVTIGLSRYPENEKTFDKLFETADKALYRGKMKGRNCFIIYLPEKHANIVLKTEKDKALSSMYLHSLVFSHLTRSDDLASGIANLFNFISSYFMIDHVAVQTEKELKFQKIHQLARNKDFKIIDSELIRVGINKTTEMYYLNDAKRLVQTNQIELYNQLCEQQITSTCYTEISYQGKSYGMLRADMTGLPDSYRIWQYADMDILLTTARTIALILHYTGRTLEDL